MALQSGLTERVDSNEMLVRFAWQSNQFTGAIAKRVLFMPRDGEVSVFRCDDGAAAPLVECRTTFERQSPHAPRAAAFLRAVEPQRLGLHIVADEPPPRHAAIRGWRSDGDEARAYNGELARRLAAEARVESLLDAK